MSLSDFVTALRDGIASDSALLSWAALHYGREHQVWTGVDARNPPDESQYPLCHIYPRSRSGEHNPGEDVYTVRLVLGVHDAGAAVPQPDNSIQPDGIIRLDEFTTMAQEAARTIAAGLDPLIWFLAGVSVEYETVEFYPFFLAEMELSFIRPQEY